MKRQLLEAACAAILAPIIMFSFLSAGAQTFTESTIATDKAHLFNAPNGKTDVMTIKLNGGVSGTWLTIARHNHRDDPKGFDPSMTSIVVDFKPVATKRKDGRWEITFISDLPNPPP